MPNRGVIVPPQRAARILEQRTRLLAARGAAAPAGTRLRVLACQLGDEFYGLPLEAVAQVLPPVAWAPVAGALPAVLGLFSHAGQMVCLLDLALALGRAAPQAEGGHVLLLRAAGSRRFALRVERVAAVAEVAPLPDPGRPVERAVTGHALAPPELAGGRHALLGLIDPHRLLQPFMAPAVPSGA
ncbi:chemotaxis protein CheW [Roseomonas sp. M0104]|uniref:Chemotaxis protein CheW n=1 Tax=Teichococcus coralli TaxID=2545983 RepID=A0A845BLR0_9PROT|nr:chemotaxis protein CheW [Pseudoroseomonas coralli]MXP64349.1 chemotaxis protein CheW [Pseudoroseomonas coralli]